MTREEAIKVIRKNCPDASFTQLREALETLIPELAESEDEKIRKDIIAFLQSMNGHCDPAQDWDLRNRWLPYLEKQKEMEMPDSTGLIELWNEEKEILREKDFRGDWWRLAQNAFMDGVARGYGIKQKEQKPVAPENDFVSKPKTSIEILKQYLVWAENIDADCPYTWKEIAAAIKDGIAALKLKPTEWNEEDENMRKTCIAFIGDDIFKKYEKSYECIDWLKNLRPQQKQEFGEDDKRKLNRIYEILGHAADDKGFLVSKRIIGDQEAVELQDFLESLLPRLSWRPSEEQMKALLSKLPVIKGGGDKIQDILESLYDDLKKL